MNKAGFKNEPSYNRPNDGKIYLGVVKKVIDFQKMGRLAVYIPEFGGEPNDEGRWFVASYASPFAGTSNIESSVSGSHSMDGSQQSYGFWAVPPDLNNEILVMFVGGEQSKCFWFAFPYSQNMNHMVPAIASNNSFEAGDQGILPPVVEYNKKDSGVSPSNPVRARFDPLHQAFERQGLYTDFQRGPTSASARRESPSRVMGLLSPRGHGLYIDDNVIDEHVRIRTRNGAQILMNDTTGFIYFITPKGNSWLEISDDGIDAYTAGSYSVRAEQDINFRADQNIILSAGKDLVMTAGGNVTTVTNGTISNSAVKIIDASSVHSTSAETIYRDGYVYDNTGAALEPSELTLFTRNDRTGESSTAVSRMPSHEPWNGHPRSSNLTPPAGDSQGASVQVVGLGEDRSDVPFNTPTESQQQTKTQMTGEGSMEQVNYDAEAAAKKINIGQYKISEPVLAAIKRASEVTGVDYGFMMAMAAKESTFNPNAIPINKKTGKVLSSAKGLYQIIDKTWANLYASYGARYNVPDDRFDPYANALMAALLTLENDNALRRYGVTNRSATDWYMAHFMGPYGASKILKADRNVSGVSIAGVAAANANPWVFYFDNGKGAAKTSGQIIDNFRSYIEPRAIAFRTGSF